MATYFHGGNQEMETSDGLHTLYLMNPNYNHNNNSHHHNHNHNHNQHHNHHQQAAVATAATTHQNMILLNSSLPHALSHPHVSHAPPPPLSQSHFLTIPFAQPISADDTARSGNSFHYNLWGGSNGGGAGGGGGGGGQIEVSMSGGMGVTGTHPYQIQLDNSDMLFRRPAVVSPTTNQQGLSLSLSSQPHNNNNNNRSVSISVGGGGGVSGGSSSSVPQVAVSGVLDGSLNGVHNFIMGSKYLKAAQELLDEAVSVGKGAAEAVSTAANDTVKKEKVVHMDDDDDNINGESEAEGGRSSRAAQPELTVTQRQELQMKKTKLISMLNEVEQTYRQYNHQMKTVVSSFEQVAGFGSAKCYTSLALKTISKQFRCLKDAITSQVKEISKSLGEEVGEDCLGVKGDGSTRLRMIDHQLRQQRALQQLGMIQHNAWRPQRGLPERAVSVLRAWLFEHFLHPYPKDSDKHMLAKQTGLTRNQVSNWFINARVRLWKPMVEEMYLEEVKDQQEQKGSNQDSNNNNTNNNNNGVTIAKSPDTNLKQQLGTNGQQLQQQQQQQQNASPNDISNSTISTSPNASSFHAPPPPPPPGFTLIGTSSSDMDGLLQYKKPRGETQNSPSSILSAGEINFSRQVDHQSSNLTAKFGPYGTVHDNNNSNNGGGFGTYHQIGELGRFNPNHQLAQNFHHSNNGSVSLTLGLPPGENLAQNYFSGQNMHVYDRGLQMAGNAAEGGAFCGVINNNNNNPQAGSSPHSNMGFQNMEVQNRKGYAAQLLPDFVA